MTLSNYNILTLITISILLPEMQTEDAVFFHLQPQNFSVVLGEVVSYECTFNGSLGFPTWIINHIQYAYSAVLPPNHHVDFSGSYLTVNVADVSMNGSSYQCAINSCYSLIGKLHILKSYAMQPHSGNSSVTNNENISATPTTALLSLLSQPMITYTDSEVNNVNSDEKVIIISATLSGTAVVLICIIVMVISCGLHIKYQSSKMQTENAQRSPEIQLSNNEAYETIPVTFRMDSNAAYTSVRWTTNN